MARAGAYDVLRFVAAAAGPAMLVVLLLRLAGYLSHAEALIDLVALLIVGVLSPILAAWLSRRR